MKQLSNRKQEFNNYRFAGLNPKQGSNNYLTMNRVSEDGNKIVIRCSLDLLQPTKYGYAFILDAKHVVFIKDWQVSSNWFGNEVMLDRNYYTIKEWGDHSADFEAKDEEDMSFDYYKQVALNQASISLPVKWRI